MTNLKNITITGAAAEGGSGALAGWRGMGALARRDIVAALIDAGEDASHAPKARSCRDYAGQAVNRLNNLGYVTRAARRSPKTPAGLPTRWDARWIVSRAHSATADVGDAAGEVVLTVELTGTELEFKGDTGLAATVGGIFDELRDAEVYQAGDVTDWMQRFLRGLGATRFGVGYYVPNAGRTRANAVCASLASRWGTAWICPLLPVATTEELRQGIARGFSEDVQACVASFVVASGAAKAEGKELSGGEANRLLRVLGDISERVVSYRGLCGDDIIRPIVESMNGMITELQAIARRNGTEVRGSLLELDAPVSAPAPVEPSPAERAAERAAQERQAAASVVVVTPPAPFKVPAPAAPLPPSEPNGTDERFGLLELD